MGTSRKSEDRLPAGFQAGVVTAGIKASGNPDLAIVAADAPCAAGAVFTTNRICAAPVRISRAALKRSGGLARAVVVNAGNANCCTGKRGEADAKETAHLTAAGLGAEPAQVQVCSTGVIGHHLPMDRMKAGIEAATGRLGKDNLSEVAGAIMTTDTVPKTGSVSVSLSPARTVTLSGCCKGSGMIAPNMATMLAFLFTDANLAPETCAALMREAADQTFNQVTVDGDTSTNDTALLLASGAVGGRAIGESGRRRDLVAGALNELCDGLARMLAADGEGATTMLTVLVTGAKTASEAAKVARTIAESPLVKTAVHGRDPNWGRILMAAGRSGVAVSERTIRVTICGQDVFADGAPTRFDPAAVSKLLSAPEVTIEVALGRGRASGRMLTCDYSKEYITINADYHT